MTYTGFNVFYLSIKAPDKPIETVRNDSSSSDNSNSNPTASANRLEVKQAIDDYEAFTNQYCDFMKKYQSSPDSLSLLADYGAFMTKYAECANSFERLSNS